MEKKMMTHKKEKQQKKTVEKMKENDLKKKEVLKRNFTKWWHRQKAKTYSFYLEWLGKFGGKCIKLI